MIGDERIYPTCAYCNHRLFWVQEYWCCLDEWCEYRGWSVREEVVNLQADDAAEYNGDNSTSGSGAQGGNGWGNVTGGCEEPTANSGWYGNYQPRSEQGQDVYQYAPQQHSAYHQNDHQHDSRYNDRHSDYQNGYQQNGQQDDVDRSDYHRGRYQSNVRQSATPSDAPATMGSPSSAGQTNPPTSTDASDNEAASMIGNPDEERVVSYVEEQPAVGMDARNDQRIAIQAVGQFAHSFPEHLNYDTRYQYPSSYPPEASLSDGSDSSDTESNIG